MQSISKITKSVTAQAASKLYRIALAPTRNHVGLGFFQLLFTNKNAEFEAVSLSQLHVQHVVVVNCRGYLQNCLELRMSHLTCDLSLVRISHLLYNAKKTLRRINSTRISHLLFAKVWRTNVTYIDLPINNSL